MQTELFEDVGTLKKMVRRNAPQTSIDAAKSVLKVVREIHEHVLEYAREQQKGFTDEEMNKHFNTYRSTYRARRSELVEMGLITNSGNKRSMDNGRMAIVWVIKE
tara:strand:+ start:242 stop:556 length:315 start_codon:yes stop_codon:yes gene_type:complete